MNPLEQTSRFQKALEVVEALPPDDQAMLVEIIQQRLRQQRRDALLREVEQSEKEYETGDVRRGSVTDLFAELEE